MIFLLKNCRSFSNSTQKKKINFMLINHINEKVEIIILLRNIIEEYFMAPA